MKRFELYALTILALMSTLRTEIQSAHRAEVLKMNEKMKHIGEIASRRQLVSHDPFRRAQLERPYEIEYLAKTAKSLEERNKVHTERLKAERLKQISDELAKRIEAEQKALILANQDMNSALDPANRDTRIAGTKHALVEKHRAKYTELKQRAPSLGYNSNEQNFISLYDQILFSLTPAGLARDASLDAARIAAEKTRAAAAYVSSFWETSAEQPATGSSSSATNSEPAKSSWFSSWGR